MSNWKPKDEQGAREEGEYLRKRLAPLDVEKNDDYEHDDNQDDDRDNFTPFIGCTGVDNCPMMPPDLDDDPPSEPR